MTRQAELELVPERTMDGTPEPIIADVVEPLWQHMRQKAPDELIGERGHGLPALSLGIPVAEADVAVLDREQTAIRQRDAVDIPAQVVQDRLRVLDGGFAVDAPLGPDRLGDGQVRPFLRTSARNSPRKSFERAWTGTRVGRASWLPLAPVGRPHQPVRGSAHGDGRPGTGPGVEHTQAPDEPADLMWVPGKLHKRWGGGTA